jgi:Asp-tRNA(Asn)/Glu-tRNA(Gln) amidotransferase A subunit family amidase
MKNLCHRSATEMAVKIRNGNLSPVEIIDSHLNRINELNSKLNAYVTILNQEARNEAMKAEKEVDSGKELGKLHGVPVALKDLRAYKSGVRNTSGSKLLKNFIPDDDAILVKRLEEEGAIILGKVNTPEFGHKGNTTNELFGTTPTPFDLERTAGGSSGGSAAAVAAGLAPLAQGSDAGGSIRTPAAFNNVYGLKPSFGRIPQSVALRPDTFSQHTPFVQFGPLTRYVEDAALMMDIISGPHPSDPFTLPDDNTEYITAITRGIAGKKVAYTPDLNLYPVESDIISVIEDAIDAFEVAGASLNQVYPNFEYSREDILDTFIMWIQVEWANRIENMEQKLGIDILGGNQDDISPTLVEHLEEGQEVNMEDYKKSGVLRTSVFETIQDIFDEHDLLVTPTVAIPPFRTELVLGPDEVAGEKVNPHIGWALTWLFNMTDHPAASIPAGFTKNGLPVGLQIVGKRFADDTVLAASASFQRMKPWHAAYPNL